MACGQRPINNVVDITNYAMLLTGQPMHAFDLDRIAGATLVVRRATAGEQVVTLDDQTRTVDRDVVLIADDEGPTSIAGVMGGNRSEVQDDTTSVLMEAANWDAANIHATSLKLGLRSEASGRFEKGLAPEQALDGQAVATKLMLRADRGDARARHDRCRRRRTRAGDDPVARQEGRRPARRRHHPLGERDAPAAPGLRDRRAARRARRHGAAVAAQRRHPRGRPDRGGRAPARRQRPAPGDAAAPPRRGRRADARPAPAPPRRGRARRPRAARDRRLELRLADARRPAAPARRRPAPRARRDREPDERGRGEHAHDAARLAARRRAPQRRARAGRPRHLRIRPRLPRAGRPHPAARAPRARRARSRRRLRGEGLRRGAAARAARGGDVRVGATAVPAPWPQRRGARRRRGRGLGR